jgi:hypothetical protein
LSSAQIKVFTLPKEERIPPPPFRALATCFASLSTRDSLRFRSLWRGSRQRSPPASTATVMRPRNLLALVLARARGDYSKGVHRSRANRASLRVINTI